MKNYFFIALSLALCIGCNETITSPLRYYGNMTGFVRLNDSVGKPLKDYSGVNVFLENTNDSATTDFMGRWTIENIPTGNYTIVFSKAKFAIEKQVNHQFVGGGTEYIGEKKMYALLSMKWNFFIGPFTNLYKYTFRDSIFLDSNKMQDTIFIKDSAYNDLNSIWTTYEFGVWPAVNSNRSIIIILGKGTDLSLLRPSTYDYMYWETTRGYSNDTVITTFSNQLSGYIFSKLGYHEGEKIYYRGYLGGSSAFSSSFPDIATGKTIYTAFDSSAVKSFLLP
jgi:hypothetical protein